MYVYLTKQQELFIKSMLETGRYNNATEVMHDALRALKVESERDDEQGDAAAIVRFDRDRDVEFFRSL